MKKILSIFLIMVLLCVCLAGCADDFDVNTVEVAFDESELDAELYISDDGLTVMFVATIKTDKPMGNSIKVSYDIDGGFQFDQNSAPTRGGSVENQFSDLSKDGEYEIRFARFESRDKMIECLEKTSFVIEIVE